MAKKLDELLKQMVDSDASDLHLKTGRPPIFRIHGKLLPTDMDRLKATDLDDFLFTILNDEEQIRLKKERGIDIAYSVPGVSRFRVNIFFQRGTMAMVIRTVPFDIPTLASLGLPSKVEELANLHAGLVLVTGPTGSGKSTTLASVIEYINQRYEKQIITIEDPIEFLFRDSKCSIVQREIGQDTDSYPDGLRMIFRQDPDVIVIGEMRDLETIQTAMSAAETGHLVYSTLHTQDASQTIDRIIDAFPASQQRQVRIQISQVLRGVISQRLVPRRDGKGRIAAVEVMLNSPVIAGLLLDGHTSEIYEAMRSSVENFGMQTLEQSLVSLVNTGKVSMNDALASVLNPGELTELLRGVRK